MLTISFECPDDILQTLSETPEQFAEQGRMLIAVKLFELGRLSSGQAARFAGMERVVFLDALKVLSGISYQSDRRRIGKGYFQCQKSVVSIHPLCCTSTELTN